LEKNQYLHHILNTIGTFPLLRTLRKRVNQSSKDPKIASYFMFLNKRNIFAGERSIIQFLSPLTNISNPLTVTYHMTNLIIHTLTLRFLWVLKLSE